VDQVAGRNVLRAVSDCRSRGRRQGGRSAKGQRLARWWRERGYLPLSSLMISVALCSLVSVPAEAVSWERLEAGDFVIFYAPGYERDARLLASWVDDTRALVHRFLEVDGLTTVRVYLHPKEDWSRSPYQAYAQPHDRSVHFLTPADSPNESVWYRKNLIHEYGHLVVKHRMGRKFWGYRHLPDWFEEGLVEYIAVMASDDEIRRNYRHYFDEMKTVVHRGDTSFLFRTNVYAWGIFTIAFFLDRYGHQALLDLLGSRARTFAQAFEQVTGLTAGEFSGEWAAWLLEYIDTLDWVRGASRQ